MTVVGSQLILGGQFQSVGGHSHDSLVAVDATTGADDQSFTPSLGGGPNNTGEVDALATDGTNLYAGGQFTTVNGLPVKHFAEFATGAPQGAPVNDSPPSISGTPQEDQTLAADPGAWTGSPTSYSYQWRDCDPSGFSCTDIAGATNPDYTLTSNDVGHTIVVRVTATNGAGTSQPAVSPHTDAVSTATSANAPTVTTGTSGSIDSDTANVNATVDGQGEQTTYWFIYGTDGTTFPSSTPRYSLGNGNGAQSVTGQLASLQPSTTYYYEIVAQNASGTATGGPQEFTTSAAPVSGGGGGPLANTGSLRAITASGATVFGLVNPNGTDTTYWFQYGPNTGYGSTTPSDDAGTDNGFVAQADLTALQPATTYHYRIVAQQGSSTPAYGADRTFVTLGPRLSQIAAIAITTRSASVSVNVDPAGKDTQVHIEYATDTSYGTSTSPAMSVPASGGPQTLQIQLGNDLVPSTTYHFRVVATNGDGTTDSGDYSFATNACPNCGLPTLSAVQASANPAAGQAFDGSGVVSATVNPDGLDTDVRVEWGTESSYGTSASISVPASGGPQTLKISLSGLAPRTVYHFRVVATNPYGPASSGDQTFTACTACEITAAPTITNVNAVNIAPDTGGSSNPNGSEQILVSIDPHGLATDVQLVRITCGTLYGVSSCQTSEPPSWPSAPDQTTSTIPSDVTFALTDLSQGSAYEVVATNAAGRTVYGAPSAPGRNDYARFEVPGPPAQFLAGPEVTYVTTSAATVTATLDTQGSGTWVYVKYWSGSGRPVKTLPSRFAACQPEPAPGIQCASWSPVALQIPIPGSVRGLPPGTPDRLKPGTTYHAELVADNGNGTTTSTELTFTTSGVLVSPTVMGTSSEATAGMTCTTTSTCHGKAQVAIALGQLAADAGASRAAKPLRLIVIGTVAFRIRGHHHAVIKIPLNGRGRQLLRHLGSIKAFLRITFVRAGRKSYTVLERITLVRRQTRG